MSQSKNNNTRTIITALVLCLVCSVMVSAVAVGLRPKQQANALLDLNKNVLMAANLATEETPSDEVARLFSDFEPQIINLATGKYATPEELANAGIDDIMSYDAEKAVQNPALRSEIAEDPARVGYLPKFAKIYIKSNASGKPELIALPVKGYGLWGTIYGFLTIQGDGRTIEGISFYQHKETAGLGSRITEPVWRAEWQDKQAFDEQGNITVGVVKAGANKPNPNYIDGISGATITSRGVHRFIHFWLGDGAYKAYLDNVQQGAV